MLPRLKPLLAGVGILLSSLSFGNGIKFTKGTWNEILLKAKQEKKLIFVDFYADWCGPCKWMSKEVFTEASVGDFFNENFINVQIDAESEFLDLVERSTIDAYPTLIFFDANDNEINRSVGALDIEDLLDFGRSSLGPENYEQAYLDNPKDPKSVWEYASALNASDPGKASMVIEEYFTEVESSQLIETNNWKMIEKFINPSSVIFEEVFNNIEDFYQTHGDELMNYMLTSVNYLIDEAVEESDLSLINKSAEIEFKSRSLANTASYDKDYYRLESTYIYHYKRDEFDQFVSVYDKLVRKYLWEDESELASSILSMNQNYLEENPDSPHAEIIQNWCDRCVSLDEDSWKGYYAKAVTNYSIGDEDKAVELAKIALKKTDDDELKGSIEEWIDGIENPAFMGWSE